MSILVNINFLIHPLILYEHLDRIYVVPNFRGPSAVVILFGQAPATAIGICFPASPTCSREEIRLCPTITGSIPMFITKTRRWLNMEDEPRESGYPFLLKFMAAIFQKYDKNVRLVIFDTIEIGYVQVKL